MPYVYKGMGLVIPGIVIFAITVPVSYFISINVRGQEDTMDYYNFTQNNIPGMIIGTMISTFILYIIMGAYQRAEFPEVRAFRGKMGGDSRCVRADMPRAEYVERIRRGVLRPEPRQSGFGFHVIL